MNPLADTTDDGVAPGTSLDFEGQRARAAVMARLTGGGAALKVGRYDVGEPLGHGGFATVYAGFDPKLQRRVAIKILRGNRASGSGRAQQRMAREARALAQLRHPHVVQVFDVGEHDGDDGGDHADLHIVMELLEGPTLDAWLAERPRDEAAIVSAYAQAALGLAAAHAVGVVHRDFKPSNAMFAKSGRLKVLDFGLANVDGVATADSQTSTRSASDTAPVSLTQSGMVMGTPRYMAPEQHRARPTTERSDQYSWCIALWEAVVGESPFPGQTVAELALEKRSGISARPPSMSRRLYAVLARGLSTHPDDRFDSMTALLAALRTPVRSRGLVVGAVALGAIGVGAWATAGPPVHPLCAVQTPPWRSRFASVLEHATPARGSEHWGVQEKMRLRLERFADQYPEARQQVCDSPDPSAEMAAAAECLQRGRQRFDSLLDSIEANEGEPSRRHARQVLGLPVPRRCLGGDVAGLYAVDAEREDALDALEVTAAKWIARGEPPDADTVARISAQADALGDHWVASRVAIGRSMHAFFGGDSGAAAQELRQAIWLAETADDPLLAAELLPVAIAHRVDAGMPPDELDALFARNRELLDAAGQPLLPRLTYMAVHSIAETMRGNYDAAVAEANEAARLAGDPPVPGTESTVALSLVTAYSLQVGSLPPDELERGLHRALALGTEADDWYGNSAAIAHHTLSDLAMDRSDVDGALAAQWESARHISRMSSRPTPALMYTLATYGRLLSFRGADELGLAHLRAGYEWINDTVGPLDVKLDIIASMLFEANMERGRPARALVWADRQIDHSARQYGADHVETAWPHLSRALALSELGRVDEAQRSVDRAEAIVGDNHEFDLDLWQVRGELRLAQGRYDEARDQLLLALEDLGVEHQSPYDRSLRGDIYQALAATMDGLGDPAQAGLFRALAAEAMRGGSYWHQRRADALMASD